jgi:peptide deformylase
MNLQLVSEHDPILKQKLKPFEFSSFTNAKELADNLFNFMKENNGIGLSANQVGIDARVFVLGLENYRLDVFNPEIINIIGKDFLLDEGCLSFKNIFVKVKRPSSIHVKFQNSSGEICEEIFSGMTARVFLHEYDHLEGITFKEKVSSMKWDLANKRKLKHEKRRSK